ncbi:MAG: hypothetical protein Q4C95_07260 [Planctomycetia bacterium]|nr:hypothetical protein [Planctomycetia bacterium]
MLSRKAIVDLTIRLKNPPYIPFWVNGTKIRSSDIFTYDLSLPDEDDSFMSEWGFERIRDEEGNWKVQTKATLQEWKEVDVYQAPRLDFSRRLGGIAQAAKYCQDRYRLATLGMSGFSVYCSLRGAEHSAVDFLIEPDRFLELMELIFNFETSMFDLVAKKGFHAIEFCDDWGPRQSSKMTLSLWRRQLKSYYAKQFRYAKELGLDIWFNTSSESADFFGDFKDMGVSVVRIRKPSLMEIGSIGRLYRGKLSFAVRLDELFAENNLDQIQNVQECLSVPTGGFIGMVPDFVDQGTIDQIKSFINRKTSINEDE